MARSDEMGCGILGDRVGVPGGAQLQRAAASTHQVLALFLIPGHPMGGGKVPQSVSSSVSIALFMSGSEVRTDWLVGGREPLMS